MKKYMLSNTKKIVQCTILNHICLKERSNILNDSYNTCYYSNKIFFYSREIRNPFFLCRKHAVTREQSQGHHDQFMKCTNNKLIYYNTHSINNVSFTHIL